MRNFYKFTFIFLFSICAKAQVPTVTITSNTANTELCSGVRVTLYARATFDPSLSINSYSWLAKPASAINILSPNTTSDSLQVNFLSGGSFTVFVTCGFSPHDTIMIAKRFVVAQTAKSEFNATFSNEGFPNQLILTNYSTGSIKNYWVFDNNLTDKDSSFNTVRNYATSGSHTVTLISLGGNNCNDISSYVFDIAGVSDITLPNIFSPNGDGVNEVFKPNTKGISKLSAAVYNRNGILMYSWDKVSGFWDGHTTSGQACIDGVYFIVLDAEGFDGKEYKLKGNITLMH